MRKACQKLAPSARSSPELRLRSGGDVASLASDDGGGLPGNASLHDAVPLPPPPDDVPSLTSDELGEEQVDSTEIPLTGPKVK